MIINLLRKKELLKLEFMDRPICSWQSVILLTKD